MSPDRTEWKVPDVPNARYSKRNEVSSATPEGVGEELNLIAFVQIALGLNIIANDTTVSVMGNSPAEFTFTADYLVVLPLERHSAKRIVMTLMRTVQRRSFGTFLAFTPSMWSWAAKRGRLGTRPA